MAATRWGICCTGKICSDFVVALRCSTEDTHRVVAVAARTLAAAKEFAAWYNISKYYGSYDELAKDQDVEIVYVGAIATQHHALSLLMMSHNKHVLCEKPVAMHSKQLKEMISLAERNKVFFMEGIWSRFFPTYRHLMSQLSDDIIGDVNLVQATFAFTGGRTDKSAGWGGVMHAGLYAINLACMVLGNQPEDVTARAVLDEKGCDIMGCIILKYAGGKMAHLTYSYQSIGECCAYICGSKGKIKLEAPFWCPTAIVTPSGREEFPLPTRVPGDTLVFGNSEGLLYEADSCRQVLITGKTENPLMPHCDSAAIMAILDEVRAQIGVKYHSD